MAARLYPINPDRNTPWNELPLLPIHKDLYYHVEILEQLGNAKAAIGKLQGRSIVIPNQGLLINTISLQEAKASSEIENIFTTNDELYKAYSEEKNELTTSNAKEVLRYKEALWSGFSRTKTVEKFDQDYFIMMYRQIKQTNDGLRSPIIPTRIITGGTGSNAGKVVYTPPRGTGILENKLANLIDFVNDDDKYKIDPLLKMAICHFQFEAIHPFRDGNGRIGRVLNIHVLTQKGVLDYPILYVSRYIIENKDEYYKAIQGVSMRGDWKNWLIFMLKAVEVTSNLTFQKINEIISAKEAIQSFISKETDIKNPDQITNMIFTQPFSKVKHFTDQKIYAENTARNYLNELNNKGILEKRIIDGHHYYLNIELYHILSK